MDARCVHDLLPGQCVDCAPTPPGLTARVYRTASGSVFHRTPRCAGLADGQRFARHLGLRNHDAVAEPVGTAMAAGLGACLVCFPGYQG